MDYCKYSFNNKEITKYSLIGMICAAGLTILFYGSLLAGIVFSPLGLFYLPVKKEELIKKRKARLKSQFKEGLYALSSSISVGKSVESAFEEALKDLKIIYYEEDAYILKEFKAIVKKINTNQSIEAALLDFAMRAEDEDITNFTNVFITAKRSGGNLVEIMGYTIRTINEKMEILDNINIMISGKKYEQKILSMLLPGMILYLRCFSGSYTTMLYKTNGGRIAMTIALVFYITSYIMGKKIVEIEV